MTPLELLMLRKTLGLSQEEAAQACGVKRVQVSRWETGVTKSVPAYVAAKLHGAVPGAVNTLDPWRRITAAEFPDLYEKYKGTYLPKQNHPCIGTGSRDAWAWELDTNIPPHPAPPEKLAQWHARMAFKANEQNRVPQVKLPDWFEKLKP